MSGRLPQIQPRDEDLQLRKLINQMRRNLPGPALLRFSAQVDLLTTNQTIIVPDNANGWVTTFMDLIVNELVGVQTITPEFSAGTLPGITNVAGDQSLSATPVVGEVFPIVTRTPMNAQTDAIYAVITAAASGPTTLTATVYIGGYFL